MKAVKTKTGCKKSSQKSNWHKKLLHYIKCGKLPVGLNSDAVSSVVALMLLLAVIATFISLYSTSYIPGLKEQSEIEQIKEVKESFMKFSSDIEHIAAEKVPASYGQIMPLGAGDILMSPEKSSGTLAIMDLGNFAEIYTANSGGNETAAAVCGMVKASFEPSYTFWEKQGYSWQYGYINATKGDIETPVSDYTMEDVLAGKKFSTFAESFVTFKDEGVYNSSSGNYELESLEINVINMVPGDNDFVSGNSMTTLGIISEVHEKSIGTDHIEFRFINSTGCLAATKFAGYLKEKTSDSLNGLHDRYDNAPLPENNNDIISMDFDNSLPLTIRLLNVTISAS